VLGPCLIERGGERGEVVGVVDLHHVPVVGLEPADDVLAEGEVGGALDRDVVVVVEDGEPVEPERAGQRGRFAGDALHHVAVAGDDVGAVVDDPVSVAVEAVREEPLTEREPDGHADALAERAGADLDPGGDAPLRVARRA
jgi:hypothetical protein